MLAAALVAACASPPPRGAWDFFGPAGGPRDPWFPKAADWQARARAAPVALAPTTVGPAQAARSGALRLKMAVFAAAERRDLARRIQSWAVAEARRHFRFDAAPSPEADDWPTIGELLERGGDDCDGLDLIAYQLLREFGFPPERVFRLIVRRDRDGGNHMLTVWFEDEDDPWVLDGTGAATLAMRRFSELEGWTPTKLFNEWQQYRVVAGGSGSGGRAGR